MTDFKFTRRHLPHMTAPGAVYFVTFRTKRTTLSDEEITVVLDHLKEGRGKYYDLLAAVVMPDHAHILILPKPDLQLERIMKGIKGVSARKINESRKSSGPIWQDESFDRIIRNQAELLEKMNYMLNNPLKKGMTEDPYRYCGWYFDGS